MIIRSAGIEKLAVGEVMREQTVVYSGEIVFENGRAQTSSQLKEERLIERRVTSLQRRFSYRPARIVERGILPSLCREGLEIPFEVMGRLVERVLEENNRLLSRKQPGEEPSVLADQIARGLVSIWGEGEERGRVMIFARTLRRRNRGVFDRIKERVRETEESKKLVAEMSLISLRAGFGVEGEREEIETALAELKDLNEVEVGGVGAGIARELDRVYGRRERIPGGRRSGGVKAVVKQRRVVDTWRALREDPTLGEEVYRELKGNRAAILRDSRVREEGWFLQALGVVDEALGEIRTRWHQTGLYQRLDRTGQKLFGSLGRISSGSGGDGEGAASIYDWLEEQEQQGEYILLNGEEEQRILAIAGVSAGVSFGLFTAQVRRFNNGPQKQNLVSLLGLEEGTLLEDIDLFEIVVNQRGIDVQGANPNGHYFILDIGSEGRYFVKLIPFEEWGLRANAGVSNWKSMVSARGHSPGNIWLEATPVSFLDDPYVAVVSRGFEGLHLRGAIARGVISREQASILYRYYIRQTVNTEVAKGICLSDRNPSNMFFPRDLLDRLGAMPNLSVDEIAQMQPTWWDIDFINRSFVASTREAHVRNSLVRFTRITEAEGFNIGRIENITDLDAMVQAIDDLMGVGWVESQRLNPKLLVQPARARRVTVPSTGVKVDILIPDSAKFSAQSDDVLLAAIQAADFDDPAITRRILQEGTIPNTNIQTVTVLDDLGNPVDLVLSMADDQRPLISALKEIPPGEILAAQGDDLANAAVGSQVAGLVPTGSETPLDGVVVVVS